MDRMELDAKPDRILWFMYNYRIIIGIAAGLELLKMLYIICSSCCSCITKPKAFLLAILDLMFGIPGLSVIVIPLILASVSPSDPSITANGEYNEEDLLQKIAMPLLLLAGLPTITGLLTVLAVYCKSYCFTNTVIFVRLIIILLWAGVVGLFTLFYIKYYRDTDYSQTNILVFFQYIHFFFGAPGTFTITQLYFIYILFRFRSHELSASRYFRPARPVELRHMVEVEPHVGLTGNGEIVQKVDV